MSQEEVKEVSQEKVKESQEQAMDVVGTTSDSNYRQDMMKYKTQRNELRVEMESINAQKEEDRVKKLGEDGKLKELLSERDAQIKALTSTTTKQNVIVDNYKKRIINDITSDEERREYLFTKTTDFLEELQKEKDIVTQNDTKVSVNESRPSARSYTEQTVKDFASDTKGLSSRQRQSRWTELLKTQR